MSPWRESASRFISGLSGPIDQPSPITSRVTPWRMSLWLRPSWISDLVGPAQHVDEARRDREPGGVDLARAAARDPADRDDPVAADRDVADDRARRRCRRRSCRRG